MEKSITISNSINSLTIFNKRKKNLLKISYLGFILLSTNVLAQNSKMKTLTSSLILESNCQLGEGVFWDSDRKKLWFVDIEKGFVHQFDPKSCEHFSFLTGQRIGTLVPSRLEKKLILGLQDGIYTSNFQVKQLQNCPILKNLVLTKG
jgi:hypothetical protein